MNAPATAHVDRESPARATIALERQVCARNYAPLPVVVDHAEDVWVWDVDGRRYLDFMSAYSAVSHGHCHPRLVAAAIAQMRRVCLTSRAFHGDMLGPFLAELCRVSGMSRALPMNTGAEAVETAIKAARRWGHLVRGLPPDRATILVADGNFHGRTTTIVGFSSEPDYRAGFGPFAPAFRHFRFGDMASLDAAHGPDVCAVLVEPILGEGGIVVPPPGWLSQLRAWCDRHCVLLLLDEVQSGLGRTGRMFAFEHEDIRPDGLIVGKALGGGILPVSAFLADDTVMGVFDPGSHGSTFGGNALAAAVGLEALRVLQDEQLPQRSAALGRHLLARLGEIARGRPIGVRGLGLWAGVDLRPSGVPAAHAIERLLRRGVLTKDTHGTVIRISPPLTIDRQTLDWGIDQIAAVLDELVPRATGIPASAMPVAAATSAAPTASAPFSSAPATAAPATAAPASAAPASACIDATAGDRPATQPAEAPHLLMCAPDHFEVSYRINPWMDPAAWARDADTLRAQARASWQGLIDTFRGLGARVETMPALPGLPDLVFTANSALVLDRVAVLARFLEPQRRAEEPHVRACFERLAQRGMLDAVRELPPELCFEGAGDALWDDHRAVLWTGWGQRSSRGAAQRLSRTYGVETVSLALASPRYYHLDTCLCPLDGGAMLWYPPAFMPDSGRTLRAIVGDALIAVGDEDATRLGVNAVSIGRDLVTGYCSDPLRRRLGSDGYRVTVLPLDPFRRAGGSAFCLTLRLDRRTASPPAGTA